MSDIVSEEDRNLIAAEYVLGTLDSDERVRANDLLEVDPEFRDLVSTWERRLGELYLMVEPVEPDSEVWQRIKARLDGVAVEAIEPLGEAAESALPDQPPPGLVSGAEQFSETKPSEPGPVFGEFEPAPDRAQLELLERLQPSDPGEPVQPIAHNPEPIAEPTRPEPISEVPAPAMAPKVQDQGAMRPVEVRADPRRGRVARWQALAACTTVIAAVLAGLMAAWRYVPDRVPPQLRPAVLLNIPAGPTNPAKRPAPADSQFQE